MYYNEQKEFGGNKYHIACFKCKQCNKSLSASNALTKDLEGGGTEVYCKGCHLGLFGPEGFRGAGKAMSRSDFAGSKAKPAKASAPTAKRGDKISCSGCGTLIHKDEKFCGECGTKNEPEKGPAKCGGCGAVTEGAKFCPGKFFYV